MVALAGAGGKTSLMWHLASRLASRGVRVAATTTTRVGVGEEPASTPVVEPGGLEAALRGPLPPLVVSGTARDSKLLGLEPERVDALAARVDHLVVEADGARGLPLKLPRRGEPVLPSSTTHLVVVVGLAALDQPASRTTLFDLDALAREGVIAPGTILEASAIRMLLLGPRGYLPALGSGPRAFVAVNGGDLERASRLADALWHPCLEAAIASSAREHLAERVTNVHHRVAGIVLAAGLSERFGAQKLTAGVGGVPLVRRAVESALGAGLPVVCLVVGRDGEEVLAAVGPALRDPRLRVARNPAPERGMGASLALGLQDVRREADAVMVLLADMPGVDASLASSVLSAYASCPARVAAPLVGGRTGHPAILRSDLFDEIEALDGDEGARAIVEAHRDRTVTVELADAASQVDVDTRDDLVRFTGKPHS